MPGFEAIDHTADLALVARGRSIGQLFVNAALGMTSFLIDLETLEPDERIVVEFEGLDLEGALVGFLQELIYQAEVHGRLCCRFDVRLEDPGASPVRGQADCHGETIDPARHTVHTDIKAATYHDLRIVEERDDSGAFFTVRIVFDI